MNESDYGGGTPVLDVWRRDFGLAIGHLDLLPKLVSLPVRRLGHGDAELALRVERPFELAPGASFDTLRSFVSVHRGDHFATLRSLLRDHAASGAEDPDRPGGRLRTDLVRLGLRA